MTTASYRQMAEEARQALRWEEAAEHYAAAIANYPRRGSKDSLAERDIANMENKRRGCLAMASA